MRVAILGAFHNINFGDQLLLKVMMEWVHEKFPRAVVRVPFIRKGFCDFKPRGPVEWGGGESAFPGCDAAIWGGGGYFGEPHGTYKGGPGWAVKWARQTKGILHRTRKFREYARLSALFTAQGTPYVVMATGVGPVVTPPGRRAIRSILEGARWVTVRDQESLEWANRVAPAVKAQMDPDVLLSLPPGPKPKRGTVKTVAVHVDTTAWNYMERASFRRIFTFLSEKGLNAVLLAAEAQPPSGGVQEKVLALLPPAVRSRVKRAAYRGTAAFLRDLRDKYDLLLTTKLHAGIVAYTLGKIPLSISTQVKAQRFFDQVGLADLHEPASPAGVEAALRQVEAAARDPKPFWRRMEARRETIRRRALAHRRKLWGFLDSLPRAR